jgi:hypothetical protein
MERLLDATGLEPPEPLERALSAARGLAAGDYVRMLHRREPCILFPKLEELGFAHLMRPGRDAVCEIFIWRQGDGVAEMAAKARAGGPDMPCGPLGGRHRHGDG